MLVTPGKQDLQKRMLVREGHITPDTHPAPDERADASEDDAELGDAERCGRGCHALRVVQRSVLLKGSPRYLALSGTTAHQLMAQGMPESSAYRILKQGWSCPGYNQRCYPQHDGPGGFAHLETPERFVRASVLRTLAQWDIVPRRDLVEDLTQDGLLACWQRRHAPHIQHFPRYYAAMLRGLITQHCKRLQREQQRLRPWEEAGPC